MTLSHSPATSTNSTRSSSEATKHLEAMSTACDALVDALAPTLETVTKYSDGISARLTRTDYLMTDQVINWMAIMSHHLRELLALQSSGEIDLSGELLRSTLQDKIDFITSELLSNNFLYQTYGYGIDQLIQDLSSVQEEIAL
jgi:hypothetical protein